MIFVNDQSCVLFVLSLRGNGDALLCRLAHWHADGIGPLLWTDAFNRSTPARRAARLNPIDALRHE